MSVNLALALQQLGGQIGLVDADVSGPSIPGMLGLSTGQQPEAPPSRRPFFFAARERAGGSPLVERLFALPGVTYVLIADNVVTIGKELGASWAGLKSAMERPSGRSW